MSRLLVIPHFNNTGGSGKYIVRMLNELLATEKNIFIGGQYSKDYVFDGLLYDSNLPSLLDSLKIPLYTGVKLKTKLFYILKCSLLIIFNIFALKKIRAIRRYDGVILTSSIQLPIVLLLNALRLKQNLYLVIQENYRFGLFEKGLLKALTNEKVKFIAITIEVHEKLIDLGLNSILIPNKFNRPAFVREEKKYDLVYVGGDQKIKGSKFIEELQYSKSFRYKVIALGYSGGLCKHFKGVIEKKNFVEDVNRYYLVSKVLLLPISSYHFCRPAIEAGLLGVPFLITDFGSLYDRSDYIKVGRNCLTFKKDNIADLAIKIEMIMDDYEFFSKNAFSIADKFVIENNNKTFLNVFN